MSNTLHHRGNTRARKVAAPKSTSPTSTARTPKGKTASRTSRPAKAVAVAAESKSAWPTKAVKEPASPVRP